jgi:hypothetical protein
MARTALLNAFLQSNLDCQSFGVLNLAAPVNPGDATSKSYVDGKSGKALLYSGPANPIGTASTVGVMQGLAGGVTPAATGRLLIIVSGYLGNDTAGRGAVVQIRYGTGGAPANGAAVAGTALGSAQQMSYGSYGTMQVPFSVTGIATGLLLGTAVWIDISLASITGGNSTAVQVSVSAVEV